jgi:phosphotriesterase-related protein
VEHEILSSDTHPSGKAVTVLGAIDPADLGTTMMHEHIFVDIRSWSHPPAEQFSWRKEYVDQPVSMGNLGVLRRDPLISRHNSVLNDDDLAVAELGYLAAAGGNTVVEMGCLGVDGQRRELLPEISRRAKINIVAAAGFYREDHLPQDLINISEDDLAKRLRAEIVGNDYGGAPAGVIGEMGTGDPMTAVEAQNLRIAAAVAVEHGLSLHIHLEPSAQEGVNAMNVLGETDLPPHRIVLGHADYPQVLDLGYVEAMAQTGAYLGMDTFGLENYYQSIQWIEARDTDRVKMLRWLLENGYGDRLVVSHDTAVKTCLRTYGGHGYDHFLRDIAPELRSTGVSEAELRQILVDSPRQLLTIDVPV